MENVYTRISQSNLCPIDYVIEVQLESGERYTSSRILASSTNFVLGF